MLSVSPNSLVAITNCGTSWNVNWNALLAASPRFANGNACLPGWPIGAPVALIDDASLHQHKLSGRAEAVAEMLGRRLREVVSDYRLRRPKARLGVVIGTSHGEAGTISVLAERQDLRSIALTESEWRSVLSDSLSDTILRYLCEWLPSTTVSAACASGCVALDVAQSRITSGVLDACVVVGLDCISRVAYVGFRQIGALAKQSCRPFDVSRDGTIIGEAALGFIVERREPSTQSPQAILGVGSHSDARHPVEPTPDGIASAIDQCLADAGMTPSQVSAVYWHGTGTIQNDLAEADAAKQVFGDSIPPGTATKGLFGHCMGASSLISVFGACESVATGLIPPACGLAHNAFPWLNLVQKTPSIRDCTAVLVVALAFGGINTAVLIGRQKC